jgi:hypothetical protein
MPIAGLAQLRQNECLLTGSEGDNNGSRHNGNNSEFGKVALADIAESISLCQSFVVWFSHQMKFTRATDDISERDSQKSELVSGVSEKRSLGSATRKIEQLQTNSYGVAVPSSNSVPDRELAG